VVGLGFKVIQGKVSETPSQQISWAWCHAPVRPYVAGSQSRGKTPDYLKHNLKTKRAGSVAQGKEHLPAKHKALNSNPNADKN
jgi:hypothetical protein